MGTRHRRRLHRADAGRGRDAPAAPDLDGEARRRRGAGASGGVAVLGAAAVAVAAAARDARMGAPRRRADRAPRPQADRAALLPAGRRARFLAAARRSPDVGRGVRHCARLAPDVIKRAMRFVLLVLLAVPLAVAAQDDDETLLGAGLYSRPKFDGSSKRSLDPIPVVRYSGKPWFARTTQGILEGGGRWQIGKGVAAGAQLAYEAGPLDHHPGASIGVHLEVDRMLGPVPLNALVRLRQFLPNGRGMEFDARATIR